MRKIIIMIAGLSIGLLAGVSDATISRSDNVVSDSVTQRQWQDDTIASSQGWENALNYCDNLTLNSHSDWRLPNLNELTSIVDRLKDSPAIIDGFVNTANSTYWSSTTYEHDKKNAWFVHFGTGSVENNKTKTIAKSVRCVRDL